MDRRTLIKYGGSVALGALPGAARARRSHDFYFSRLSYESGDWDAHPRAAGQVLAALAAVSSMDVDPEERVLALGEARVLDAPFCFLAGHKLVQFTPPERRMLERFLRAGGFLLVDDASANPRGLFMRSFETEIERMFGAAALAALAPGHSLYSSFFQLDAAHGAGLRAMALGGRARVLVSQRKLAGAWSEGQADALRLAVNIIHYALGA